MPTSRNPAATRAPAELDLRRRFSSELDLVAGSAAPSTALGLAALLTGASALLPGPHPPFAVMLAALLSLAAGGSILGQLPNPTPVPIRSRR